MGTTGDCKCYDACAYEDYIIKTPASSYALKDMATISYREDTTVITFTRCRMDRNVARHRGGLLMIRQVLRDAANITFDSCSLNDNVAFVKGGLMHLETFQNSGNKKAQIDAIKAGQDVWVGETKFLNTNISGTSSGFYGGAFFTIASHRFSFENTHMKDTHATFYTNETHWRSTPMTFCPDGSRTTAGTSPSTEQRSGLVLRALQTST